MSLRKGIPRTPDLSGKIAIVTGADLVVDGGALVQAAWLNRPHTAGGSPQIIQGLADGTAAAPARS